eukprot:1416278-Prymnesium_polylepis.1
MHHEEPFRFRPGAREAVRRRSLAAALAAAAPRGQTPCDGPCPVSRRALPCRQGTVVMMQCEGLAQRPIYPRRPRCCGGRRVGLRCNVIRIANALPFALRWPWRPRELRLAV